ncbi:hypothetical protein L6164_004651 [Bauhinia variegata]|uniref:Uncharacterized protein n=1 Tax=Bauhinia variegata TaxID=167791 RepID=A0ACB9Q550_BAUVA|nr:hypothetical protein L6164_004651 [Bauhinia variegata]
MANGKKKEVELLRGRGLLDTVFSWSIRDVLNDDLYKNQVKKIPDAFSSKSAYLSSFFFPLIEETRADLSSSITTKLSQPCEIFLVRKAKTFQLPSDLFYNLVLKRHGNGEYQPLVGDLVVLTRVKPMSIHDLMGPYVVSFAFIHGVKLDYRSIPIEFSVLSSKPIITPQDHMDTQTIYALHLTNMTTNMRLWMSLNTQLQGSNINIIRQILQNNSSESETCARCCDVENCNAVYSEIRGKIYSSDLNDSQKEAVLSCIKTRECYHENTVKLIWGPPGTGKTKTVALMLSLLLKINCRTLTCAPTNIAVVQVAKRLVNQVINNDFHYGLGDIVLFGNRERMMIDDHDELHDVFLDYRVDALRKNLGGWTPSLCSMISLLEDPEKQYLEYLKDKSIDNHETESKNTQKILKASVSQALEERRKEKKQKGKKEFLVENEQHANCDKPWTFQEFLCQRFNSINEHLTSSIPFLYAHLPTCLVSLQDFNNMSKALALLASLKTLLNEFCIENATGLKQIFYVSQDRESQVSGFLELRMVRKECLHILKLLPQKFFVPTAERKLKNFCLKNACLIFCTVSSSVKLHVKGMPPLEILVMDEAAQLKECESTIPLQLSGLRHAILIGDERQLPAMVQSKISQEAAFGRSLFERLVLLGRKKHLLDVQHRMHPSISSFPNRKFYDCKIKNAQNVKEKSYKRNFLQGKMYGSYSFLNVTHGKEELDNKYSQRNMVEASIVSAIVENLHKEYVRTKKKVTVGVISPYMAQVQTIEAKVKRYDKDSHSGFNINVRSVDGFQGGEEDVIIISTVRCNGRGSIGFLSDKRRVNVALTRARHCLWILGHETTLVNSDSVWRELVIDAKKRGCFYNAQEDKSLGRALLFSLIEQHDVDTLKNIRLPLFRDRNTRWKVRFRDEFWYSMGRIGNRETCEKVLSTIEKLSSGWRQNHKKRNSSVQDGVSCQLLEACKVNRLLSVFWTVDILQENSGYIQVILVWDVLPKSNIQKIAKRLDISSYSSYSPVKIEYCKYKCVEGNSVVPMRWPVEDSSMSSQVKAVELSKPFALLSIGVRNLKEE